LLALIAFVVGLLLVAGAAICWERLFFSRRVADPLHRKAASVVAAWLSCAGGSDILVRVGAISWDPGPTWLGPTILVAAWFLYRGYRLRRAPRQPTEIARDFE
jgi:hypothetical protein